MKRAEKAVAEAEAKIAELENQLKQIEEQLATPDGATNSQLFTQYSDLKKQLSTAEDNWTMLSMELEEITA